MCLGQPESLQICVDSCTRDPWLRSRSVHRHRTRHIPTVSTTPDPSAHPQTERGPADHPSSSTTCPRARTLLHIVEQPPTVRFATIVYADADPTLGDAATAGHAPGSWSNPTARRGSSWKERRRSSAWRPGIRALGGRRMPPPAGLLYTDGLVEHRTEPIDGELRRLLDRRGRAGRALAGQPCWGDAPRLRGP